MKTGIIIPCYNEEKRLNVSIFLNFIMEDNEFHLCFVNDGSKDDTISVLKEIQNSNPEKVSVIDMKKNSGKAAAVRAGVRYLSNRGDIDFIGFIDADLSTDFKDFNDLLKTLKTNDKLAMVFGSRSKNGTQKIKRDTFRSIFSMIIQTMVNFILHLPIQDSQCGAKVFRTELATVLFAKNFFSRWLFDIEMFLRLKKYYGKEDVMNRIYEQPLKRWVHVDDSKIGIKDAIKIPFRLASIWVNYNLTDLLSMEMTYNTVEPRIEVYA
ncbi:dolichyl-phosphate beta-glucosyltransferase [Aquimarina hainanensis]|uniref:dolichyl-phosphate beta-glucosyltransferase n=1 Tax=Aquimarina hainanensis TaxID=1578017 RepID=A0ABW5N8C8_9FLAO